VIDPLEAIEVALVDGVNAHPASAPIGPGRTAHADKVAHRTGMVSTPI
jgi:hypothetical protein